MRVAEGLGAVAAAALVLAGCYAVGALHQPTPPVLQGDSLGPLNDEPETHYAARAAESLHRAQQSATATQPHFALVAFDRPRTCPEASPLYQDAPRVNAIVPEALPHKDTPEPVPGTSRVEVCERELRRAWGATNVGEYRGAARIAGVVVTADATTLRHISQSNGVATVEVLPPDAVWGAFAVSTPGV